MVDVLKKGTTFNCRYLLPGILRIYNIMRHRLLVQVKLGLAVVEDGAPAETTLFLYVTNGHSVKLFCDKLLEGSLEQEFFSVVLVHGKDFWYKDTKKYNDKHPFPIFFIIYTQKHRTSSLACTYNYY